MVSLKLYMFSRTSRVKSLKPIYLYGVRGVFFVIRIKFFFFHGSLFFLEVKRT